MTAAAQFHFSKPMALAVAVAGLCLSLGLAGASNATPAAPTLGQDETEFVFIGKCPNGEKYRLFAYTRFWEGQPAAYYDYEGPAGSGTIRSSTTPRTLAVRVCRPLAEIIDDH